MKWRRNGADGKNKTYPSRLRKKRRYFLLVAISLVIGSLLYSDSDLKYPNINDDAEMGYQTHRRASIGTKMVRIMRTNKRVPKILHKLFPQENQFQISKKSYLASEHNGIRNPIKHKPIINTFFHRIPKQERITGMSDDADSALLQIWEESWQSSGWETRVLTLEDAQKHPDFEKFETELEGVWLGKKPQYDKMCYYRWLAMSSVGGGWMSDYDLLPMPGSYVKTESNFNITDRFTVHDQTLQGDAIPSLLSGTKEEWDRMAGLLLDNAIDHKDDRSLAWTDMRALIEIYDKDAKIHPYDMMNEVILGHLIIPKPNNNLSPSKCAKIKKLKGVHICHHAMKGLGLNPEDRPEIATQFMKQWKEVCNDDNTNKTTIS